MTRAHESGGTPGACLLLRMELRRAVAALRSARAGTWFGALLPLTLVGGALWAAGPGLRPDLSNPQGRVLMGVSVSALPALVGYTVLFRSSDAVLLRLLGVSLNARYVRQALRLLLVTAAGGVALLVPWAADAASLTRAASVVLAAGSAAWGASLFALSGAAQRMSDSTSPAGPWGRTIPFDPVLAAAGAAPLVFAPLIPLLAGAVVAVMVGAMPLPGGITVGILGGLCLAAIGAVRFARGLPRFGGRAAEMAFAPPTELGDAGLVFGRGLAAVLPRRAGAVRARDAAVVGRRFRWAARCTAPVAVLSVLALLRAGDDPVVRQWVAAAVAALLIVQGAATIALGHVERSGPRWIDRVHGLAVRDRFIGRWAVAFGLALGAVVPVGIVWALKVPGSAGWEWLVVAAIGAAAAAVSSLAIAGR